MQKKTKYDDGYVPINSDSDNGFGCCDFINEEATGLYDALVKDGLIIPGQSPFQEALKKLKNK